MTDENEETTTENIVTSTEDVTEEKVDEAKAALEETKKVLAEIKKERMRLEKATADNLVNGRSFAGQTKVAETEDEKWAREAKVRYAGTGMDPT